MAIENPPRPASDAESDPQRGTGTIRGDIDLRRIMSTTHNVKRIIVGALLSGSVALAGLG